MITTKSYFDLETVCLGFLRAFESGKTRAVTLAARRSNVNVILKNMENRPYRDLTEEDFADMIQRLRSTGGNKEPSLMQKWTTIRAIREYAYREGIIEDCTPWPFPEPEMERPEAFSVETQDHVLQKIRQNVESVVMEILLRENLELKELIALRVRDVHFDLGYVEICQRAIKQKNRFSVKKLKTQRIVYLSHESMQLLRKTMMKRKKWFFPSENSNLEDCLIFANREGNLHFVSHYIWAFKQLSEQCGIEIHAQTLTSAEFLHKDSYEMAMQVSDESCGGESRNASLKKFRKYQAISIAEQKTIMKQDSSVIQNAFLQFKLVTGTRTAEILGLTWDKVKKENHTVHIQNQLAGGNSLRMIRSTKNFRQRVLHLPEVAFQILDKIQEKTQGILSPIGKYDFVFCLDNGSPLNKNDMNEWLRKILGHKDVFLHNLRSTAATMMYKATGVVSDATRLLGHLDEAVTEEHYIDVLPDSGAVADSLSGSYRDMEGVRPV